MIDFADAAARHWADGEHLYTSARLENADQLFGFAAECALKVALVQHGVMPLGADPPPMFFVHMDRLWDRMPSQAMRKRFPTVAALLKQANPYSGWSTRQRYEAVGSVQQPTVDAHRKMAQRLLGAVQVLGSRARV